MKIKNKYIPLTLKVMNIKYICLNYLSILNKSDHIFSYTTLGT